jgi:hypothetical protein
MILGFRKERKMVFKKCKKSGTVPLVKVKKGEIFIFKACNMRQRTWELSDLGSDP